MYMGKNPKIDRLTENNGKDESELLEITQKIFSNRDNMDLLIKINQATVAATTWQLLALSSLDNSIRSKIKSPYKKANVLTARN